MDWKAIPNYVLLVGLFVAMVTMFNQVNGRIDAMQAENNRRFDNVNLRFDAMQTEMDRRFDAMQTQMNRRFDAMQAEMDRRFDAMQAEMTRRFDEMNRRFDQVLEVLRLFEGRITRLEEKAGVGPGNPD